MARNTSICIEFRWHFSHAEFMYIYIVDSYQNEIPIFPAIILKIILNRLALHSHIRKPNAPFNHFQKIRVIIQWLPYTYMKWIFLLQ